MTGSLTDNEIMLKVKSGDLEKMTLLFECHQNALYGSLYHMTRHRETSEDIFGSKKYSLRKNVNAN
jgi:RNA polymerase sigma-70 factor (ECF subfamily)